MHLRRGEGPRLPSASMGPQSRGAVHAPARPRSPPACYESLFEIGAGLTSSTNASLGPGQTRLATSRWALGPFARQGPPPSPHEPQRPVVAAEGQVSGRIARSLQRVSAPLTRYVNRVGSRTGHPHLRRGGSLAGTSAFPSTSVLC